MTILADVELRPLGLGELFADEARQAGIARRRDRLDRRAAALAGRREGGGAHGDDLLASVDFTVASALPA